MNSRVDEYERNIEYIKSLFPENFEQLLGGFCRAIYLDQAAEDECIKLISDDIRIQKIQLQIILGVLAGDKGRLHRTPTNRYLELERRLIAKINDAEFLTSLLWDFIIRSCDGGQICCPNASQTVAMLIEAGANPHATHLSLNYQSPGYLFVAQFAGNTIFDELNCWVDTYPEVRNIITELNKSPLSKPADSVEDLFMILAFTSTDGSRAYSKNTRNTVVDELINQRKVGVKELTNIVASVSQNVQPLIAMHKVETNFREEVYSRLRRAEGIMLEAIYLKEHAYELQLAKYTKISLIFSPLIIPLFVAGILALTRYIHMNNQAYTVSAEDLSFEQFDKSKTGKKDNKLLLPLNKRKNSLRKAVVFNAENLRVSNDYERRELPFLFHGTSKIPAHDIGHLPQDVRIYKPMK